MDVGYVSYAPDYDDANLLNDGGDCGGRGWSLRDHSKQLGRCTRCHSLRIDCHSCDWRVEEEGVAENITNNAAEGELSAANDGETMQMQEEDEELDSEAEDELANDILRKYKRLTRRRRGRTSHARRIIARNTKGWNKTNMTKQTNTEEQQEESDVSEDDIPLAVLEKRNAQMQKRQQQHETRKKRRRLVNATCSLAMLPDASANDTGVGSKRSNNSSTTRTADHVDGIFESSHHEDESKDQILVRDTNDQGNLESLSTTNNNAETFLFQEEMLPINSNHPSSSTQEELFTPGPLDEYGNYQEKLLTPRPLDEDGNCQEKLLTPRPLDENGDYLQTQESINEEESFGGGNDNDENISFQGDPDDDSSTDDDQVLNTLAPISKHDSTAGYSDDDDYSIYSEESYEYYNDFFDEEETTAAAAPDQTPREYKDLLGFIDKLASDIEDGRLPHYKHELSMLKSRLTLIERKNRSSLREGDGLQHAEIDLLVADG